MITVNVYVPSCTSTNSKLPDASGNASSVSKASRGMKDVQATMFLPFPPTLPSHSRSIRPSAVGGSRPPTAPPPSYPSSPFPLLPTPATPIPLVFLHQPAAFKSLSHA